MTVHYTDYTVQTNFGCSGVGDTVLALFRCPVIATLPDGSHYLFTYEATPGASGNVTGRIKQITLPTGGTITYTYTGGSSGITCGDGSAAGLTRVISPGGTWTYGRSNVSGNQWQTTITDPVTPTGNQTVISFQKDTAGSNNFYETQRQSYQGTATGTPLQTVVTCYDATGTPVPANCPTTAVTSPINRKSRSVYLPDSAGRQSETDSYFNGFGLQTELDEYDFGSAAVGPLVRKIITSYVSLGDNLTTVSSVSVKDPSNNIVAQTTYAYDETAVTTTSGTPQHGNINGARGNLTTWPHRSMPPRRSTASLPITTPVR